MQIGLRSVSFNLGVHQTAQANTQCRKIRSKKLGIAHQREIRLQLGFLLANVLGNRFAAHLFLALKQHLHVDRQFAASSLHQGFQSLHFHPELSFVVDGAPCVDVLIPLGRLERRGMPLVERFSGLHIVVRIAKHGRFAAGVQPVGIDKWMSLGCDDLDILHADAAQFAGHTIGCLLDVGLMFLESANAWNAKKVFKFVQEALLITTGKIDCGRRHG